MAALICCVQVGIRDRTICFISITFGPPFDDICLLEQRVASKSFLHLIMWLFPIRSLRLQCRFHSKFFPFLLFFFFSSLGLHRASTYTTLSLSLIYFLFFSSFFVFHSDEYIYGNRSTTHCTWIIK
jgi:hypothetical protein